MDRMLVLSAQVALPTGHRVEVTEQSGADGDDPVLVGLVDLDTGISFAWPDRRRGETTRWIGRVLECAVTLTGGGVHTHLTVDPIGAGGAGATVALRDADAAAEAAKAEADRWGGSDRPPPEEPDRFW